MTQLHNTIAVIREHFTQLATEEQRKLICEEFVKLTMRCEQQDLPAAIFFQMISTIIGAGIGGHGDEVTRDQKYEALYLASAMLFVGAEGASKGELSHAKFLSWAKRRNRDDQRQARKERRK